MAEMHKRRSLFIDGFDHVAPIPVASRIGPLVTCSVTAPYEPGTKVCPEGAKAQVATIFRHVGLMLSDAGGDWSHVAKMTFYAPEPSKIIEALNETWKAHFPDPISRPSRHTMKVIEDWGDILLCCDFLAYIPD